jgi:hypothetical protein
MENPINCWHCSGAIEAKDAYCRYCGKGQGSSVPFRYTHCGIIVLTLLIGPLAIPFILKSPKIGTKSRVGYLLLNLVITVFMIKVLFDTFSTVNRQIHETIKIINQTGIGIGEMDKLSK